MISWCKRFLVDWWLCIFMAFLLWYRNYEWDRYVSIWAVMIGLIDLIQYGVNSGMSTEEAGKWIYIILWLQVIALAITAHSLLMQTISAIYLIIISVISFVFIFYGLWSSGHFFAFGSSHDNNNIQSDIPVDGWYSIGNGGENILGCWWWIYAIGIIIPILLISYYMSPSILLLLLYAIIIGVYVLFNCDEYNWGSAMNLLSIGFLFITWLVAPVIPSSITYN